MNESSARLVLLLQKVRPKVSSTSALVTSCVEKVCQGLLEMQLWSPPFERSGGRKKRALLESLQALLLDTSTWKEGIYTLATHESAPQVEAFVGKDEFELHCIVPVEKGKIQQLLMSLTELSLNIWNTVEERALIGAGFSIRPYAMPYPRPRPPRHSHLWSLGDAAYFISDEFHRVHPLGDPEGVARLKAKPAPPSITRESHNGLTVIRVSGPADDSAAFAKQRHDLEVWMSAALELPLHPDFRENGDHRLTVLSKIPAPPFTFYDQMTRTGFKAVSEGPSGHIDKSTRQELENTLKVKALDNEQTVDRTIVIFASREAALKNAAAVTALGASGAVYVGDDTRLWNPLPEKNLIDVDWSKA